MDFSTKPARRPFATVNMSAVNNYAAADLPEGVLTPQAYQLKACFLRGEQRLWGLPFRCGDGGGSDIFIVDREARLPLDKPEHIRYVLFLHAADFGPERLRPDGLPAQPIRGSTGLGETVCRYTLEFEDGTAADVPIRRRLEISQLQVSKGESSFGCVPHRMPHPVAEASEQLRGGGHPGSSWGETQSRVGADFGYPFGYHWIYALENPFPDKKIAALSFAPLDGKAILFAITHTAEEEHPLRLLPRAKLVLSRGKSSSPPELAIDRGNVISVRPASEYPDGDWERTYALQPPAQSDTKWIVEYAAHPNACIFVGGAEANVEAQAEAESEAEAEAEAEVTLSGEGLRKAGKPVAADVPDGPDANRSSIGEGVPIREFLGDSRVKAIPQRERTVILRVIEAGDERADKLPVRIHIHGESGEYIAPVNRHRQPNSGWFEDYSADCAYKGHFTSYIDGQAEYRLPLGTIFVEITRGFEYRPVRRRFTIGEHTGQLTIELERRLDWRRRGWVTSDTHVHFITPQTALLQGKGEDIHVVNLLASQWGELFSNIGDFDGATTIGADGRDGRGRYLVRVGTENRQAVLGHISLLGYEGDMILPLCTGGPMESALGDALEATMLTWARQGRAQNGLVVLPHFPSPRGEEAAVYLSGLADAIEVCSWSDPLEGISPYTLSDWYRFLNCGYLLPIVGGTDKMSASIPVGLLRTYTRLPGAAAAEVDVAPGMSNAAAFSYEEWKQAVRRGETFVTVGPVLEFAVNGQPMGSTLALTAAGDAVDVRWEAASAAIPLTRVELVQGGEVVASEEFGHAAGSFAGSWKLEIAEPTWLALRVRGAYPGRPEAILAHSSPVMMTVGGRKGFNAVDAATIIEQIQGATLFFETLATRPPDEAFDRMRRDMAESYRELEERLQSVE